MVWAQDQGFDTSSTWPQVKSLYFFEPSFLIRKQKQTITNKQKQGNKRES